MSFIHIYARDMIKFWRLKPMLLAALIQPVLWLAFFGLAMADQFSDFPPGTIPVGVPEVDYLSFMLSGIIAMTILFTCLYGGVFLQLDRQFGMLKQIFASPLPRSHILAGLSLSGLTKSLIQVTIIVIFGLILGARLFPAYSIVEIVLASVGVLLFIVLFAAGLMFLSSIIALTIESHEGVQAVITLLTLPLFFASNALYPVGSLPVVIRFFSYINPLSHFITGMRYFTLGPDFHTMGQTFTITMTDMGLSLAFLLVFDVVLYLVAIAIFRRAKVV